MSIKGGALKSDLIQSASQIVADSNTLAKFSKPYKPNKPETNRRTSIIPEGAVEFSDGFKPTTYTVIDGGRIEWKKGTETRTTEEYAILAPKAGRLENGKTVKSDYFGQESAAVTEDALRKSLAKGNTVVVQNEGPADSKGIRPVTTYIKDGNGLTSNVTSIADIQTTMGTAEGIQGPNLSALAGVVEDGYPGRAEYQQQTRHAQENFQGKWKLDEQKRDALSDAKKAADIQKKLHPRREAMMAADPRTPEFKKIINANWNSKYDFNRKKKDIGDYEFKIGDVVLSIPPTHLTITQMRTSYNVPILGNESKPVSSYGARTVVKINCVFTGGNIDQDLKRILVQFKYCPFNIVKSKDLFSRIVGDNSWLEKMHTTTNAMNSIPVTMDSYVLYNIEGHPGTIGATIQMSLFNYVPYFDGITQVMEYYKYDPEDKPVFALEKLEATTNLEEALHPYNMDIEDIVNDPNQRFFLKGDANERESSSYVSFAKLTTLVNMSGIKDGNLEIKEFETNIKEKMKDLLVNSISVAYENNFAWTPVIGYSCPTAQYLGPGETHVSMNIKTADSNVVSTLLKTYNDSVEENIFSYYDDRYLVLTPLTRLAQCTMCSMKEVVTSSIAGHPGWTDINIMMSKNTFHLEMAESNPAAQFDRYWGLSRLLDALDDPRVDASVQQAIKDAKMELDKDSVFKKVNDAGNKVPIRLSAEAVSAVELVFRWMQTQPGFFSRVIDTTSRPELTVSATSDFSYLNEKAKAVINVADEFAATVADSGAAIWATEKEDFVSMSNIESNFPEYVMKVYAAIVNSDPAYAGTPKYMEPINNMSNMLVDGDPNYARKRWNSNMIVKQWASNKTYSNFKENKALVDSILSKETQITKEYFSQKYVYVKRKEALVLDYTPKTGDGKDGLENLTALFLCGHKKDGPDARKKLKNKPGISAKVPDRWPAFGVSTVSERGVHKIFLYYSFQEGDELDIVDQAGLKRKIVQATANDTAIKIASVQAIPHHGHRYYPGAANFVKFNLMDSATVGNWFVSDAKKQLNNKLIRLNNTVSKAISPVMDWKAWTNVYVQQTLYGKQGADKISSNPNNPFVVMEQITVPVSRKDLYRRERDANGNPTDKLTTKMNPITEQMRYDSTGGATMVKPGDTPFSCTSNLLLGFGMTDKVQDFVKENSGVVKEWRRKIAQEKVDSITKGNYNPADIHNDTRSWMGVVVPGGKGLMASSETTPNQLSGGMIKQSADDGASTGLNNDLTKTIQYGTLYPEQFKVIAGEKDPLLLGKAMSMDRGSSDYTKPKSLNGAEDVAKEKYKEYAPLNSTAPDKDVPLTEVEKYKIIYDGLTAGGMTDDDHLEDPMFKYLMGNAGLNVEWTRLYISTIYTMCVQIGERFMNVITNGEKQYDQDFMSRMPANRYLERRNGTDNTTETYSYLTPLAKEWITAKRLSAGKPLYSEEEKYNHINLAAIYFVNEGIRATRNKKAEEVAREYIDSFKDKQAGFNYTPYQEVKKNYLKKVKSEVNVYGKNVAQGAVSIGAYQAELDKSAAKMLTEGALASMLPTDGLQNAFPTFKLYIISSDTSEYKYYSLDAYYDFRLMQDAMVIRSKNSPAHILKCRVIVDPRYVAIDGQAQQKGDDRWNPYEHRNPAPNLFDIDREGEKYFSMGRAPLRAGMRICLKLGYHTDPRQLDTVFIGTIVGLNGTMDSGVYEIEASGDGRELLTPAASTNSIITGPNYRSVVAKILRANTNIVHFGKTYGTYIERFSREHYIIMGLAKGGWQSAAFLAGGAVVTAITPVALGVGAIMPLTLATLGTSASMFQYSVIPEIAGRAIHDLKGHYKDIVGQKYNSFMGYLKGNLYDAQKASRQAAIALFEDLSYGNDPIDDNLYLFDNFNCGPNAQIRINNNKSVWDVLREVKRLQPGAMLDIRPYGNRSTLVMAPTEYHYWRTDDPVAAMAPQLYENSNPNLQYDAKIRSALYNMVDRDQYGGLIPKDKAKDGVHWVPIQKQHVATSWADIIMNGIKSTPNRGWNAVVVAYGKDPKKVENSKPVELVADADLEPGMIRKQVAMIDWTDDEQVAIQYAASFLKEGMERMYGGTLILRGNPRIEPWDKIYVADKVNQMYGWVEVETVIHKFDHQMGFTTHIVPNLVCQINSDTFLTRGHLVRSFMWENMWSTLITDVSSMAIGGVIAAGAAGVVGAPVVATVSTVAMCLAGILAVGGAAAGFKSVLDKYDPKDGTILPEAGYTPQVLYGAMGLNQAISWGNFGYIATHLVIAANRLRTGEGGLFSTAIRDSAGGVANGYNALKDKYKLNKINKLSTRIAEISKSIQTAEGEALAALLADQEKLKAAVDKAAKEHGASSDMSDASKKLEEMKKTIEKDIKGREGSAFKNTKSKYAAADLKSLGTGLAKGAALMYAFRAIESLPMLLETFILKSMTKAAVISISPVWSRYSLLMGGLDGWKNDDAFLHMQGVILNAKRVIGEAGEALKNYQALPFNGNALPNPYANAAKSAFQTSPNKLNGLPATSKQKANDRNKVDRARDAMSKYGDKYSGAAKKANKACTGMTDEQLKSLAMSVSDHESGWDPNAVGYNKDKAGNVTSKDLGLMQLNTKTYSGKSEAWLLDEGNNIYTGTAYLAECLCAEKGNVTEALYRYNGGPNKNGKKGLGGGVDYPQKAYKMNQVFSDPNLMKVAAAPAPTTDGSTVAGQERIIKSSEGYLGVSRIENPRGTRSFMDTGVDCSGLTKGVYNKYESINMGNTADNQWSGTNQKGEYKQTVEGNPITFAKTMQKGDQMFFSDPKVGKPSGTITHTAIFTGEYDATGAPIMIHSPGVGKVVEKKAYNAGYFNKVFVGYKRYKL